MSNNEKTGAETLVSTLLDSDVDVCFANPGTSEMHFVAALDDNPGMRCVLGLFEGVVTAAADGYGRMKQKPACTLLHLGPGLGNGLSGLHNAKKAHTPVVNIVGEHATYHRQYDAPLSSDVEAIAAPMSHWVGSCESADEVAALGRDAVQAALTPPGQVATLILPADAAWNKTKIEALALPRPQAKAVDESRLNDIAKIIASGETTVMLTNGYLPESRLALLSKIARKTKLKIISDTMISRIQRGAGRGEIKRLPYFAEQAASVLEGVKHLVLLGTQAPVSFFAYPDKPNWLTPEDCEIHTLAERDENIDEALALLIERLGAKVVEPVTLAKKLPKVSLAASLDQMSIGAVLGRHLPEHAVIVDEAQTNGFGCAIGTQTAAPHDLLGLTGGSIGWGLGAAVGAAIACPEQRVICLQADGAGMYINQALWTQARENLNITNIIFSNRKYAILQIEFARVGAHNPGPRAMSMLDLSQPNLSWASIAKGMGLEAWTVSTVEAFQEALLRSLSTPGPTLIEAVID